MIMVQLFPGKLRLWPAVALLIHLIQILVQKEAAGRVHCQLIVITLVLAAHQLVVKHNTVHNIILQGGEASSVCT